MQKPWSPIYALKGYPYSTSPKEEGTHRRLLYYDGGANFNALMAEHVRERRGKMLVTGERLSIFNCVYVSDLFLESLGEQ